MAHNLNNNFMLYAGQAAGDDEGGMYANLDASYLMSVAYQEDVPVYTGKCARVVIAVGGWPIKAYTSASCARKLSFSPFCKRTLIRANHLTNSLFLFLFSLTDRLVAKITGILPLTPRNFRGKPKIHEWETYDVRYHSFSTMGKIYTLKGVKRGRESGVECVCFFQSRACQCILFSPCDIPLSGYLDNPQN